MRKDPRGAQANVPGFHSAKLAAMVSPGIRLLDHPLAGHLVAGLRDRDTDPALYRRFARTLTILLVLEATKELPITDSQVQTPLELAPSRVLGLGLAAVPILRAGLGMLESVTDLFPDVAVGYLGLERNESTAVASSYYSKLPNMANRLALCLDPMLATGGSAAQAIHTIKAASPAAIVMVSVISAPEGIAKLQAEHPEVPIVTAAIDRGLNEKKYILPGLGDFGDRLYGTF